MINERYAVISKLTLQVGVFASNPNSVNITNNILIDLESHPQKDEVQIDWFYDIETNTFSETREEIQEEPAQPEPTQLDRIESMLASNNEELRQEGADALTLELIERGIL